MTPYSPAAIAREAREAIARDMDIYVSGSALPDKYQAAREYFTHGPECESFILTAAARIVRESGAESALENALALCVAWKAHYGSSYNGGKDHPDHEAICDKVDAALANLKRLGT